MLGDIVTSYPRDIAEAYQRLAFLPTASEQAHAELLGLGKAILDHLWLLLRSEYVARRRDRGPIEEVEAALREVSQKTNTSWGDISKLVSATLKGMRDAPLFGGLALGPSKTRVSMPEFVTTWDAVKEVLKSQSGAAAMYSELIPRLKKDDRGASSLQRFFEALVNCRNARAHADAFSLGGGRAEVRLTLDEGYYAALNPPLRRAIDELLAELRTAFAEHHVGEVLSVSVEADERFHVRVARSCGLTRVPMEFVDDSKRLCRGVRWLFDRDGHPALKLTDEMFPAPSAPNPPSGDARLTGGPSLTTPPPQIMGAAPPPPPSSSAPAPKEESRTPGASVTTGGSAPTEVSARPGAASGDGATETGVAPKSSRPAESPTALTPSRTVTVETPADPVCQPLVRPRLTYTDLLHLYKGRATAVEQISLRLRQALAIPTPVTEYVGGLAVRSSPRHVVLTGNAGDGKTFAAHTAQLPPSFEVVLDASEGVRGSRCDPVDDLIGRLDGALSAGRRLLLAINRGQLERVQRRLREAPRPTVRPIIDAAVEQASPRVAWPAEATSEVSLIDLGMFDCLCDEVVRQVLLRVADAELVEDASPETRRAFAASLAALGDDTVRSNIVRALRALHSWDQHVTMRQLWSLAAYLATGARPVDSTAPVSIRDAVGARLFSEIAALPLVEQLRLRVDPALEPQPEADIALLEGELEVRLGEYSPLAPLLAGTPPKEADGAAMIRAAWLHGAPWVADPRPATDAFGEAVARLESAGPVWPQGVRAVLRGVFRSLDMWYTVSQFPAWQVLCYDSACLEQRDAAHVAQAHVDPGELRFLIVQPPPEARRALGAAWRPPYIILAPRGQGPDRAVDVKLGLRLTPSLYRALLPTEGGACSPAERLILMRWLARIPATTPGGVYVQFERRSLLVDADPLTQITHIGWAGESA